MNNLKYLFFTLIAITFCTTHAQIVSPDWDYGKSGILKAQMPQASITDGSCMVTSASGRTVIFGTAGIADKGTYVFGAAYLANGLPDINFGPDGKRAYNASPLPTGLNMGAYCCTQLSDQSYLVGGYLKISASEFDAFIIKIKSNGELDMNFGKNGYTSVNLGGRDYVTSMLAWPDGSITAVCQKFRGDHKDSSVFIQLKSNGLCDSLYGKNGIKTVQFSKPLYINKALLDGADAFCTVGYYADSFNRPFLAKYLKNGNLDSNFGKIGYTSMVTAGGQLNELIFDSNNRLLVAGSHNYNTDKYMVVYRILNNGIIDSSFAFKGLRKLRLNAGKLEFVTALTTNAQHEIFVLGRSISNAKFESNTIVSKLDSSGNMVFNFADFGYWENSFGGDNRMYALGIDTFGRVYIGGSSYSSTNASVAIISRLAFKWSLKSQNITQSGRIKIAPNPATHGVKIGTNTEFSGTRIFTLTNAVGQVVWQRKTDLPVLEIDLPGLLLPGIYTVSVMENDSVWQESLSIINP